MQKLQNQTFVNFLSLAHKDLTQFRNSPLSQLEGDWNQNATRNCLWDGHWRRADQPMVNFLPRPQ